MKNNEENMVNNFFDKGSLRHIFQELGKGKNVEERWLRFFIVVRNTQPKFCILLNCVF